MNKCCSETGCVNEKLLISLLTTVSGLNKQNTNKQAEIIVALVLDRLVQRGFKCIVPVNKSIYKAVQGM